MVAQKRGLTASVKGCNEQTNRQTKGTAYLGKCSKYSVREMIRLEADRTVIYGSRSIVPASRCQSLNTKVPNTSSDDLNPAVDTVVSHPVAIVSSCRPLAWLRLAVSGKGHTRVSAVEEQSHSSL